MVNIVDCISNDDLTIFVKISVSLPELAVNASVNCSFHDEVPMIMEAFALWTNLSTVFCKEQNALDNDLMLPPSYTISKRIRIGALKTEDESIVFIYQLL